MGNIVYVSKIPTKLSADSAAIDSTHTPMMLLPAIAMLESMAQTVIAC